MTDSPQAATTAAGSTFPAIVAVAVGLPLAAMTPAVGPLSWLPYAAGVLGGSGLGWATYRWSRGAMPQSRWFWLVIFTFLAGLGIGSRFAYGVTHFAGMCTATMAIGYRLLAVRGR